MINQKPTILQNQTKAISSLKIAVLCLLSALICRGAFAVEVKFGFRPGATYEYELTSTSSSESDALGIDYSHSPTSVTSKFQVKTIDFEKGAFIVDIKFNDQTYRRYIKENGEISGAPGEAGKQVPFFISFPAFDWQPEQRHQVTRQISLGRISVPAVWNLLLKSFDPDKQIAEIWFAANLKLPEDRLRRKQFSQKGRIFFDLAAGVINQAEWNTEYSFNFINKEIAVVREIWEIKERTSFKLKLLDIKE
jgi:hypothetical protein